MRYRAMAPCRDRLDRRNLVTSRPNVLLLHCHDLGRHLQCYGARTVNSPHLHGLAADGVLAEQMFTTAPQCSPSRASLFTGRWPHANGVLGLTHATFAWDLHRDERHLASLLSDHGYHTELIGVHHESRRGDPDEIAARLGFARAQPGGLADTVVDRTIDALARLGEDEQPFYLQVGFNEPHRLPGDRDEPGVQGFLGNHMDPDDSLGTDVPPYLHDTESARTEIAELQGAIRHMDGAVGRILAEIDRRGLTEDTLVIFTTDHGIALPRAKCSLHDPGLEVAFIARWPGGGVTGGRRVPDLLINLDVVPTILDATGAPGPQLPLHGTSALAQLRGHDGAAPVRAHVFGELTYHDYYDPCRTVRTETHRLILTFSSAPKFMDSSQSWHRRCRPRDIVAHARTHDRVELYDLVADPDELDNLADEPELAGLRTDLLAALHRWMLETDDPLLAPAALDSPLTSPHHHSSVALLRGTGPGTE